MAGPRKVSNDPQRRERILDAALDVIAEQGVHKTSHRAIAAQAGVPLGSLTYYFTGITDILEQSFARLAATIEGTNSEVVAAATTQDEACHAVAEFVVNPTVSGRKRFGLMMEMYSYALHSPAVAESLRQWQRQVHTTLQTHFTAQAGRAIASLVEGWVMHRHFDAEESALTYESALKAVTALARL